MGCKIKLDTGEEISLNAESDQLVDALRHAYRVKINGQFLHVHYQDDEQCE